MNNGTSSELNLTDTDSAPGASDYPVEGDYFIKLTENTEPAQIKCSTCKQVTIQECLRVISVILDSDTFFDHRVYLCTTCGSVTLKRDPRFKPLLPNE